MIVTQKEIPLGTFFSIFRISLFLYLHGKLRRLTVRIRDRDHVAACLRRLKRGHFAAVAACQQNLLAEERFRPVSFHVLFLLLRQK